MYLLSKILVWKPNSFGFLFILITLISLPNTHVLNYSRNIKKFAYQAPKTFSNSFSRLLPNIGKWDSFPENAIWKMNHFLENVNAKTNNA